VLILNHQFSSFFSSCPADHVGEYCQYKNPCTSGGQKCQNGGTCNVHMSRTRAPTFQCSCPIGYTASFCEIAVSTNACKDSPCQNGATCSLMSLTEYVCTCPLGWKGEFILEKLYRLHFHKKHTFFGRKIVD
jgi:Notch-like protein